LFGQLVDGCLVLCCDPDRLARLDARRRAAECCKEPQVSFGSLTLPDSDGGICGALQRRQVGRATLEDGGVLIQRGVGLANLEKVLGQV
jgi:hypothetical protein